MSNSNEQTTPESNTSETNQQEQELVIELGNLTEFQKDLLYVTLGSFVLQILYLFNLSVVTGLFKPFIALSYNEVGAYIVQFLNTFVPYLLVIFFGIALVSAYEILVYDQQDLKILGDVFDYSALGVIILIVLFFLAVFTIPTLPVTPFYPNLVELVLFLLVLFLMVTISMIPFAFYSYFIKKKQSS